MKRIIAILFLLQSFVGQAQFTGMRIGTPAGTGAVAYFGSASAPADNGALNGSSGMTLTPPASMLASDLVVVFISLGTTSAGITHANTGGQTWTARTQIDQNGSAHIVYWCRFNGTWSANPQWTFSNINHQATGVMHVFRGGFPPSLWAVNVAESGYTTSGNTTTPTHAGITTTQPRAVAIAEFYGPFGGSPTATSVGGTGWNVLGNAQYRNTTGGMTAAYAYKLMPVAGATGSVSRTFGSSNFYNYIAISFYEIPF